MVAILDAAIATESSEKVTVLLPFPSLSVLAVADNLPAAVDALDESARVGAVRVADERVGEVAKTKLPVPVTAEVVASTALDQAADVLSAVDTQV